MSQLALVDAYETFMQTAGRYMNLSTESDYEGALTALEELLEEASDTIDDPLNPLIDLLAQAIESYEAKDAELVSFVQEAESIPTDVALLRTLMKQHGLTGSDLPEIGDKTMVSKVLSGKRVLQRQAIESLSIRFGLRPGMFLEG